MIINDMVDKLKELYKREDFLIIEGRKLKKEYDKIQEDKELLKLMIMYAHNRIIDTGKKK